MGRGERGCLGRQKVFKCQLKCELYRKRRKSKLTKPNIFFSRVHATLQPALSVGLSVRRVGRSVRNAFFNAPAHPHATKVAVYPALLLLCQIRINDLVRAIKKRNERR